MSKLVSFDQNQSVTMSSLEIAEITKKDHGDVLKDIRRILAEAEIGAGQFSASYKSSQNKDLPCFNLPRRECDLVVSGYSVKYRLAIIDRWHELEAKQSTQIALPGNYVEALEALVVAEKEKLALTHTVDCFSVNLTRLQQAKSHRLFML